MSEKYIDSIIQIWLLILIIFSPLAFGSVHLWAYTILEVSIFIMLILYFFKYLISSSSNKIRIGIPASWINIPFFFFLIFVLFQLIPFPALLLKYLSKKRYELYKMTIPEPWHFQTISICIHQTTRELYKLITYVGVFFLALKIFDSRKRIKRAVIAIFFAGTLEAFLGIFQMLTKTNKIFWFWQSEIKKGGYFGSFVNPNHFANYMGMVVCIEIGLLLSRPKIPFYPKRESWRHYINRFESYISKNILLIFLISIMGTSIFLSLSRGGIICLLFSLLLLFTFQALKAFQRKKTIIIIYSLIMAFLIWIGIDPVIRELSTLLKLTKASPQRPIAWRDSLKIIKDYPLVGVGYGNFRNIFPFYKSPSLGSAFWDHAHNEYIEYAVDTGLIGFLLFYFPIFSSLFWIIKRWFKRTEAFSVGISLGGISAISLLLMANLYTFNLHIPAISFLFFFIMAITIRSVFLYHHFPIRIISLKKKKAFISFIGFCLIFIILIKNQLNIFKAESLYNQYKQTKRLYFLKKAAQLDSNNPVYKYVLALEYVKKDKVKYGKRARDLCISAIRLNPTNPWYHLALVWVSYVTNDKSIPFKKELSLALKLDPTNPSIKRYVRRWKKYVAY